MATSTNIQPLLSLEAIYEFSGGSVVRTPVAGEWHDLAGKSLLSFQLSQTSSDGATTEQAYIYFSNAPEDGAGTPRGVVSLAPTQLVGGSASWNSGQSRIDIPPNVGMGAINVYATWENLPFRYVKFDFNALGAVDTGGRCYAHVYAR